MAYDTKTGMAQDGYPLKKGWTPQTTNTQQPVGSGGKEPPRGGSAVPPAPTSDTNKK